MTDIRLVTRADDAGLNRVTNRAIRSAVKDGIVRNIGLMAPAPMIEDAAETFADLGDKVDFGLHVTLTSEWDAIRWGPVRSGSALTGGLRRDGTFHLQVSELAESGPDVDLLLDEVLAQYEKLISLGFKLSYLDEHMLVGSIGPLAEALQRFAAEHDLICDRDLLSSGKLQEIPGWNGPGEHPGTELADHLSGVQAATYLLVGHPGTKDEEMQVVRVPGGRPGEIAMQRNRERRMFMDIEIVDYCENVGIDLLRYSEI